MFLSKNCKKNTFQIFGIQIWFSKNFRTFGNFGRAEGNFAFFNSKKYTIKHLDSPKTYFVLNPRYCYFSWAFSPCFIPSKTWINWRFSSDVIFVIASSCWPLFINMSTLNMAEVSRGYLKRNSYMSNIDHSTQMDKIHFKWFKPIKWTTFVPFEIRQFKWFRLFKWTPFSSIWQSIV